MKASLKTWKNLTEFPFTSNLILSCSISSTFILRVSVDGGSGIVYQCFKWSRNNIWAWKLNGSKIPHRLPEKETEKSSPPMQVRVKNFTTVERKFSVLMSFLDSQNEIRLLISRLMNFWYRHNLHELLFSFGAPFRNSFLNRKLFFSSFFAVVQHGERCADYLWRMKKVPFIALSSVKKYLERFSPQPFI